ncbi:MAG TPA: hypothetical protein VHX13_13040 [Acidobacteriaceae bacterium]|jgi:hypothetical protein|nr:hypothetical protein [Acidobacteriaceae bacterium]
MPAISAADAISPAIQRTRNFLFRPFRLGTYLKLCLVALVTEGMSGGSFNSSFPRHHTSHPAPNVSFTALAVTPMRIAFGIAIFALVALIGLFIYYLITRLRFAYFHCLVHNIREIRPGWRFYREPAGRFFWLNVVVYLGFLVALGLALAPFAAGFLGLFRSVRAGSHLGFGAIFALVLPLIPIFLLFILAGIAANILLRDLMLPHFALENAGAGSAWYAVWSRIRVEKGGFFVYALLRIVLPIAGAIGIFLVLIIPAVLFILAVGAVEVALHVAFGHAALGIFLEVATGGFAVVLAILVLIGVCGPVYTALRLYALIFYGNRYQLLGERLYPPPLPPAEIAAPAIP